MPNGNFSLLGTVQEFWISADQVKGAGGSDNPCLTIPIKFDFCPIFDQNVLYSFEIPVIKGELYATNNRFKCSEQIVIPPAWKVSENTSTSLGFNFPLNDATIHRIEKYRQGNLVFI